MVEWLEDNATLLIGGVFLVALGMIGYPAVWERFQSPAAKRGARSMRPPANPMSGSELRERPEAILARLDTVERRLDEIEGSGRAPRSPAVGAQTALGSRVEALDAKIQELEGRLEDIQREFAAALRKVQLQAGSSANSRGSHEVGRLPSIPKSSLAGSNSAGDAGTLGRAASASGRAAGGSAPEGLERRPTPDPWALVAKALREAWQRACKDGRLDDAHFRREVEVMQGFRAHRRQGNFAYVDFEVNLVEREYLLPTRTESYHATERYECTDTDRDAFIVGLDRLAYREGDAWHPGLARTSRST